MSPNYVVAIALVLYFLGYRFYARFLSEKVFLLRDDFRTPAHSQNDNIDYVPTSPGILLGHHYASISGLGPILGPAIAVIWGWLPAILWVVFGTIFIGAVHDFSSLVISVRSKGYSIGTITEYLIGPRAKLLFLLIIFFLVSLAMGVFIIVLGNLFSPSGFPQVAAPSTLMISLAVIVGYLSYKKRISIKYLGFVAFILVVIFIWSEQFFLFSSAFNFKPNTWKNIMLGYAFLASVLPVWLLLQSRDFINSIFLFLGLIFLYTGFFLSGTEFTAPIFQAHPQNAPPLFPFVFILIACGSISGFHSLVSSGTSAKQLNKEKDAKMIGYGGMVGESLLGLIAILATITFFPTETAWQAAYGDYNTIGLSQKISFFIQGGASFLFSLGISKEMASSLIAFLVVSFALTSLDSGTRLLRYNIEEIGKSIPHSTIQKFTQNRYISSGLAILSIAFIAFFKIEGGSVGQLLWSLFGTVNQLLGALALLLASIYLYSRGRNPLYTLIPMICLLITTCYAMFSQLYGFLLKETHLVLIIINISLIILTAWLLVESVGAIKKYKNKKIKNLDILN